MLGFSPYVLYIVPEATLHSEIRRFQHHSNLVKNDGHTFSSKEYCTQQNIVKVSCIIIVYGGTH